MLQLPYYIELGWKLKKDLHIHREQEEGNYQVKVLHKKNYVLPLSLTISFWLLAVSFGLLAHSSQLKAHSY